RVSDHVAASISTMSLLLLHATNTFDPSADGWAHVGEQVMSAALIAAIPCVPISCDMPGAATGPFAPCSCPAVSTKCRDTANVPTSISTSASFIMHAE